MCTKAINAWSLMAILAHNKWMYLRIYSVFHKLLQLQIASWISLLRLLTTMLIKYWANFGWEISCSLIKSWIFPYRLLTTELIYTWTYYGKQCDLFIKIAVSHLNCWSQAGLLMKKAMSKLIMECDLYTYLSLWRGVLSCFFFPYWSCQ